MFYLLRRRLSFSRFAYAKKTSTPEAGFTLLEILLAMTILAFVMTIIYSSFFAITQSEKRVTLSTEVEVKARNLMQMLMRDLSSAVIPEGEGSKKETSLNYGLYCSQGESGQKLDFTTSLSDSGDVLNASLQETGYFLQTNDKGSLNLLKRIDDTPDDDIESGGRSLLLMKNIASLTFLFKAKDEEWIEQWEGEKRPRAIKIKLVLLNDENEKEEFATEFPFYGGKEF